MLNVLKINESELVQAPSARQRVTGKNIVVFNTPGGNVSLELRLEDDRSYQPLKTFKAGPARPALAANEANEIEAVFINKPAAALNPNLKLAADSSKLNLNKYPVIPIETTELTVNLQNRLTDYDFKTENIQIETRVEKSQAGTNDLPKVNFEVLDWKAMRVSFILNEQMRKLLGGRRLQFRIRDKERGDSDWYTIKQIFVRSPHVGSVKCTDEMNNQCEMKGEGIEYIQQVSVDGGQS